MKRKLAGLLILLCLTAMFTGCGASGVSGMSGGTGGATATPSLDEKAAMDTAPGDYGGMELTSDTQTDYPDRENEA